MESATRVKYVTRPVAFYFALMLVKKAWNHQLLPSSHWPIIGSLIGQNGFFSFDSTIRLEGKHWITPLKNWPCVTSCSWWIGWINKCLDLVTCYWQIFRKLTSIWHKGVVLGHQTWIKIIVLANRSTLVYWLSLFRYKATKARYPIRIDVTTLTKAIEK